jgi:hypothetical protein
MNFDPFYSSKEPSTNNCFILDGVKVETVEEY